MNKYTEWLKKQCPFCAAGAGMSVLPEYHWSVTGQDNLRSTAMTADQYIAELEAKVKRLQDFRFMTRTDTPGEARTIDNASPKGLPAGTPEPLPPEPQPSPAPAPSPLGPPKA